MSPTRSVRFGVVQSCVGSEMNYMRRCEFVFWWKCGLLSFPSEFDIIIQPTFLNFAHPGSAWLEEEQHMAKLEIG